MKPRLLMLAAFAALPLAAQEATEGSRDDGTFLERTIEGALSGAGRDVIVTGFAGALSSQATLQQMTIADADGIWLTLTGAELEWSRRALLDGRLQVERLTAASIDIARLPKGSAADNLPAAEATPFRLPDLPVSVEIGEISADRVSLGPAILGEAAAFSLTGGAQLADGAGEATLLVERIDGKTGGLSFAGAFSNTTQELSLDLALDEPAGGIAARLLSLPGLPSLNLSVTANGTLDDLNADVRLATEDQERLTGNIRFFAQGEGDAATQQFEARLGGDLAPVFSPQYRPFFGPDIQLTARGRRLGDGQLDLTALDLAARSITLSGSGALAPGGAPERLALTGRIADPSGAPVLLPVGNALVVDSVALDIGFDARRGPDWRAEIAARGLDTPAATAQKLHLTATGLLSPDAVSAAIDFATTELALADPGLQEPLGPAPTGTARIDWAQGKPVTLEALTLQGGAFRLTGAGRLDTEGGPVADVSGRLSVPDLGPFSTLAGRPLGGGADLSVDLNAGLVSRAISLTVSGATTDLTLAQQQLDNLIGGAATLDIALRRDETGTHLDRFALDAAEATLRASATVTSQSTTATGALNIAEAARVDPRLDGPASVDFDVTGSGAVFDLQASARAIGATLDLDGTANTADPVPRFTGAARLTGLDLARLSDLAGRPLSGTLSLRADGAGAADLSTFDADLSITGDALGTGVADLDALLGPTTTIDATATTDGTAILIQRFALAADGLAAKGSGRVAPGSSSVGLTATLPALERLGRGLTGPAQLTVDARQTADGWALDGTAYALDAEAAFDTLLADLDSTPAVSGSVTVDGLTLQALAPFTRRDDLFGTVSARLDGSGRLDRSAFDLDAEMTAEALHTGIAAVDGLLGDRTAATASVTGDADTISLSGFTLSSGGLRAEGSGRYAPGATSANVTASLDSLAALDPRLSGPARLSTQARQTAMGWAVAGDAEALGGGVTFDTTLTELDATPLVAGTASVDGLQISRLSALAGRALSGTLSARASGSARTDRSTFDIAADVSAAGLRTGVAMLDRLLPGTTRAALAATRASADAPIDIARLTAASGALSVEATGRYGASQSALTLSARLDNIGRLADGFSGPVTLDGTVGQNGSQLSLDLAASGAGVTATARGAAAQDFSTARIDIAGTAPLALANSMIAPQSLAGTARFDLALNGKPGLSALSGTVTTQGARAVIPGPALVFEDIAANLRLQSGVAVVDASARKAEGGTIAARGQVGLTPPLQSALSVELRDVVFKDPSLYTTSVSGALRLSGPLSGGAAATGTLTLGDSELRVPSSTFGTAGPIPDIIHLAEPAPVRATRSRAGLLGTATGPDRTAPPFGLDVTIAAPNRVFVRGRGLDAELGGRLQLRGDSETVIPSGQFDLIRGRLDILGKRLTLSDGRISLSGGFEPYLRLVAETQSGDTQLFIVLDGPASSPEITFESQPELPQDEVLAQLLFGKSLKNISPLQAARLATAVATLAGKGGEGVVGRLRDQFGLADLDITTDDNGNAAVKAGAYLSENIYSDVTVTATGETEVNLNLDITPSLTARGSVNNSGETSIGLFFERDY